MEAEETNYPKNFYIFAITIIDVNVKKRKYIDIPVSSHKFVFPNRNVIFKFACDHFGLDADNKDVFDTFAVLGWSKFESEEEYNSYNGITSAEDILAPKEEIDDEE